MIGSTENFDGASVPPGYLLDDGSAFSNTAFAELFAVLGSSTLSDKRGRVEIGVDAGGVNMLSTYFGTAATLGATKTGAAQTLTTVNLPPYTPVVGGSVSITAAQGFAVGGSFQALVPQAEANIVPSAFALSLTGSPQGGVSTPFGVVQPSIVVNKIKRAC